MGGIILNEDVSQNGDNNTRGVQKCTSLFSKMYDDLFPKYLYYGMSEEQYWNGDSDLVVAYAKANEMRLQSENKQMYYQAMYIYDVIERLLPGINAFGNRKIEKFRDDLIPYTIEDFRAIQRKEQKEYKQTQAKSFLEGWMAKVNAERKKDGR